MTVARLRQIAYAITQRLESDRRWQGAVVEWQTKVLAQVIAHTVPLDKKQLAKGHPLQPLLDSIKLFPTPTRGTSSPRTGAEAQEGPWTPDQPGEAWKRAEVGPPGAFERFQGTFGRVAERR